MHPRSLSFATQSTGAPKAGRITTSSGPQRVELLVRPAVEAFGEELYAHLAQPVVHGGVVDHVAGYEDAPVGELLPRLEGVVDRTVHAVAEPELVGQAHRQPVGLEDVAVLADSFDQLGAVVAVQ